MVKKKRRRISLGTLFMLLLTMLVIAGCAIFLAAIAGDDLYAKTGDFIRQLRENRLFDSPDTESGIAVSETAEPSPTPQQAQEGAAAAFAAVASASPAPQAEPTASTFTLAVGGTVYAPKAVRQGAEDSADHYDFTSVFSGLGDTLSSADIAIVTLETTTAGRDKGYGNYNTPAEILDALRSCGVDVVALATEHALDKGYDGLDITLSELTARGLAYAGVNPDGESGARATMLRIGGVQVAVLAYTYGLSDEGREKTKDDERGVLLMMDTESMKSDITRARLDGANVVVVLPHWGTKNKQTTPENLRTLARTLAEAGADVILGTHPNVAQATERLSVTRADGLTYDAVVCYSLGSLLTDARTQENTAGMVAHLSVTYDPVSRRTALGEMYCTPVYIARQKEGTKTVYRVVDAESAQALASLDADEQAAAQQAVKIIHEVTGAQGGQG